MGTYLPGSSCSHYFVNSFYIIGVPYLGVPIPAALKYCVDGWRLGVDQRHTRPRIVAGPKQDLPTSLHLEVLLKTDRDVNCDLKNNP